MRVKTRSEPYTEGGERVRLFEFERKRRLKLQLSLFHGHQIEALTQHNTASLTPHHITAASHSHITGTGTAAAAAFGGRRHLWRRGLRRTAAVPTTGAALALRPHGGPRRCVFLFRDLDS